MTNEELKKYLISEEKHVFKGWDFKYLDGRWENEILPWDYKMIVEENLKSHLKLLDMGTGGGEFLLTLHHPYDNTSVTEGYPPNIELCYKVLSPLGIKVYPIKEDDILADVPSNYFDIIINRHESYQESEVRRVLKQNGIFITQQVGANNNRDLATFFDNNHQSQYPNMTLKIAEKQLIKAGFEIIDGREYYPKVKFFDLGAIAYFAKIITWEFKDFSVEKHFDKFLILKKEIDQKGYIESTEHRCLIVAKKI